MKLFGALAVGVLLTGSAFGAAIIDSSTLTTLCTAAGSNCGNVTFNTADGAVDGPLFIDSSLGSSLVGAPFSGGVPFIAGALGNQGNGYLQDTPGSFIDIGVDAGSFSAMGFTVDQGIYGDGQGILFTLFFEGGATQNIASLDDCLPTGGGFGACPTFIGFQTTGGDNPIAFIRLSNLTSAVGPERFNFYNLRYILAEEGEVDPEIPEPATFGLMGMALLGLGAFRKFRK